MSGMAQTEVMDPGLSDNLSDIGAVGCNQDLKEEEDHLQDVLRVLMNPLILECIFTQLDPPDLKMIRQVCSVWGDIGAAVLGDKAIFDICEVMSSFTQEFKPPSFNVKLAKNIKIWGFYDSMDYAWSKGGMTEMAKLVQIFQPIEKVVQSIAIDSELKHIPAFVFTINLSAFPNLQSVKVITTHSVDQLSGGGGVNSLACPDWRVRPSTQDVQIFTRGPGSLQYESILQSLVNASPNMEVLKMWGNVYPDLSQVCKLKNLWHFSYENVDLLKLKAMLASARKTIKDMTLGYTSNDILNDDFQFCLPLMPNLVNLSIFDCDLYRIQSSLCEERLPKLNNLVIFSNSDTYTAKDFLSNLWKRHNGILSLELSTIELADSEVFNRVSELFPNVEMLTFGIDVDGPGLKNQQFIQIIESYAGWKKLKKLRLKFVEIRDFAYVEYALNCLSTVKEPKSVSFKFHARVGCKINAFSEETKAAFLLCKQFERVEISAVGIGLVEKEIMKAFIKEHKLAIYFL